MYFGSSPTVLLTDFSDVSPYSKHAPYQSGTGDYGSADTRAALAGMTKWHWHATGWRRTNPSPAPVPISGEPCALAILFQPTFDWS